MKQEEILEYNKKCAEFMGGKPKTKALKGISERMSNDEWWLPKFGISSEEELHYDSDWNWIMEVVEAIENLGNDLTIFYNHVDLSYSEGEIAETIEEESKKEAVVQAINQFLILYNENKTN